MLYPALHRLTTTRIPEKHNGRTSKSCVKAMFSIAPADGPKSPAGSSYPDGYLVPYEYTSIGLSSSYSHPPPLAPSPFPPTPTPPLP